MYAQNLVLFVAGAVLALGILIRRKLKPPPELGHLPRVPVLPLLRSYFKGEVDDRRIKNMYLQHAQGEGLVLVFMLGIWIVHVFDHQIGKQVLDDITLWQKGSRKKNKELLLWKFLGDQNVVVANGEPWKKYSRIVKSALERSVPMGTFVTMGKKMITAMGDGGRINFSHMSKRVTLDVIGATVLGHDFGAIEDEKSPILVQFDLVMGKLSNPLYLFIPKMELWLPRKDVQAGVAWIHNKLMSILGDKRVNHGNDMLTYMLEEPGMTDEELLSNMVTIFIAGHDTTAGAISTLLYHFARNPDYQRIAREEVVKSMGKGEPTLTNLRDMPFLHACLKEALRINSPTNSSSLRSAAEDTILVSRSGKEYVIPKGTALLVNLTGIHYTESNFIDPACFNPYRFLANSHEDVSGLVRNAWMPFGAGPRQCPARNFAQYEGRVLMALLLQNWTWTLPEDSIHADGIVNDFSPYALSLPKNMELVFTKYTATE